LLDQEDEQSREMSWRKAAAIFRSNPGLTLALTLLVLVVAVISMLFPSLWLVLPVVLFAVACVNMAGRLLQSHRQRPR
jgi:MFS superfamily sulfate permease-like transporter